MAVSSISSSIVSAGAYEGQASQVLPADAQNSNPLTALQQKQAAVQAQFSSLGRGISSLADLQAKAQALKNFSASPTLNDYKGVVQAFIQSFNNLSKLTDEAATKKQSPSSTDLLVSQSVNDVRKAISGPSDSSTSSLQALGIVQQQGGTFAINQNMLDQGFSNDQKGALGTLSDVADRVGKMIDKQLSSSGIIGGKLQNLSVQGGSLDAVQAQLGHQQGVATTLSNASGYGARNAVTTYFDVASL